MRLLTSLIVFFLSFLSVFSITQERAKIDLPYEDDIVTIEANQLSRKSTNVWLAEGNVIVTHTDGVLKSPRLTYDSTTGDVDAEGPIEFIKDLQWFKGSYAEFNLKNGTGTIHNAEGFTDTELYIKAKRLHKTGPKTYTIQEGFLTACEEAVPKWSFTIKTGSIKLGGNVKFRNTLLKIKKVPVLYLPFMRFPTGEKKRSSGFLPPSIGRSNSKGHRFSQSFYMVLGQSADLLLRGDYFSERGLGQGLTFRTRPNKNTHLEIDWYGVNDRKNQGGTSFDGMGETTLPGGFRAVANFNLVSSFIFRQVFSDNFATATRPTENSRVFVSNNFQSRSFNFLVSREETVFPGPNAVIRNTPTLNFKLMGHKLFKTPFYLDLNTSAEGRSRSDSKFETPGVTQRLDFFPTLYFSVPLSQNLRLTPSLGLRETFYSDSLKLQENSKTPSGENIHRQYLELALDLKGWGLSRIYHRPNGNRWKHVIEPAVSYLYLAGLDNFDQIIRFDEHDAIANTNEVEYSISNRIFVKRKTKLGTINHEWLSFKVAQRYFIDPDFGGALKTNRANQFFPLNTITGFPFGGYRRNVSPINSLLRFTPKSGYSFDVRGDYDPAFQTFRNFSLTGFLNRPDFSLGTTYFLTRKLEPGSFKTNQLQAFIALGNISRGPSTSTTFSYDTRSARFLTYQTRLNYAWDCCSASLEYQGFNVGVRVEKYLRFSFYLKGLGSFGTIQPPEKIF